MFSYYFCLMIEGSGRPKNMDPTDPGCGSRSLNTATKILENVTLRAGVSSPITPEPSSEEEEDEEEEPEITTGTTRRKKKCVTIRTSKSSSRSWSVAAVAAKRTTRSRTGSRSCTPSSHSSDLTSCSRASSPEPPPPPISATRARVSSPPLLPPPPPPRRSTRAAANNSSCEKAFGCCTPTAKKTVGELRGSKRALEEEEVDGEGRSRVHGTPLPGQEQEILPRRAGPPPRRLSGGAGARKGRSSASSAVRAQHSEDIEEGVTSVFFCFGILCTLQGNKSEICVA
jgi:hypothetical protein